MPLNRRGLGRSKRECPTSQPSPGAPLRSPSNRVVQGMLLLAGAVLLEFTAGADRVSFPCLPRASDTSSTAADCDPTWGGVPMNPR